MRLRMLGRLELEGSELTRPVVLLLLAYLALEGPQERRFLAELFWMDTADPLNRLSSALTKIRKSAPGAVDADGLRVWADLETDVREFLTAIDEGQVERAVELYRGPFLLGIQPNAGIELEEWLYETREGLADRARRAHLLLAGREANRGRFAAAARHAEAALDVPGASEAGPENLERALVFLVAGESPRAAAVRREADGYGLDVDPDPEHARERLQRSYSAADEAGTAPRPSLPTFTTPFIGRRAETRRLLEQLEDPTCRLVTIVAPGGMGKTRLSLAVAEDAKTSFRDGARFVALAPVPNPNGIVYAIADALPFELSGQRQPLDQVVDALQDRQLLLVLDNFEHLLEGAGLVQEILERAPRVKALVTSRAGLNLHMEWRFELHGLTLPEREATLAGAKGEAQETDAWRLFQQTARRVQPHRTFDDLDAAAVARICRLVEGMPLAIELAASWLTVLSPREIAEEIVRSIDVLETEARDVPERQRSIRAMFASSWSQLTPAEQAVFMRCCVFRGGFRREDAEAVAGAGLRSLRTLSNRAFLVRRGERYHIHHLLRQFGEEKLAEADLVDETREHHGIHFLARLQELDELRRTGRTREFLSAIDKDYPNLRVMWSWAEAQQRVRELERMVGAVEHYFVQRTRYDEGVSMFDDAIASLDRANPEHHVAIGRLLVARGWLRIRTGERTLALGDAQEAEVLLAPFGARPALCECVNLQGVIHGIAGAYHEAKASFERALTLANELGEESLASFCLNNLAITEKNLGDFARAERHYREALALGRSKGENVAVVRYLNNLGLLLRARGNVDEAATLLEEGIALAQRLELRQPSGHLYSSLGKLALDRDRLDEAADHLEQALRLARETQSRDLEAEVLADVGRIAAARGDEGAAATFREGLALARKVESPRVCLQFVIEVAWMWASDGRIDDAKRLTRLALHHPATDGATRERAERLAQRLALTPISRGHVDDGPGALTRRVSNEELRVGIDTLLRAL
ncbi:MAG: tetratricopeptide repeat protein [Trueperaceae bacterium]